MESIHKGRLRQLLEEEAALQRKTGVNSGNRAKLVFAGVGEYVRS
jgi:hypothetical protein